MQRKYLSWCIKYLIVCKTLDKNSETECHCQDVLSNYVELQEELEDLENEATPTPAFEDLRGIELTTRSPLPSIQDPEPTTYRAPIDFDLGTTAATGIEVADVVLLKTEDYEDYDDSLSNGVDTAYSDEYETEDETDYEPGSEDIPIVLEGGASQQAEALPSYDPVVLLVGTPEKVRSLRHVVQCRNHCKG